MNIIANDTIDVRTRCEKHAAKIVDLNETAANLLDISKYLIDTLEALDKRVTVLEAQLVTVPVAGDVEVDTHLIRWRKGWNELGWQKVTP